MSGMLDLCPTLPYTDPHEARPLDRVTGVVFPFWMASFVKSVCFWAHGHSAEWVLRVFFFHLRFLYIALSVS